MICSAPAFSQSGYKINFKIKDWKDKTAYLGHYYGESTYIKDTAQVNQAGEFFFENKTTLPQGVYILVVNKNKSSIEFLILLLATISFLLWKRIRWNMCRT